MYTCVYIYIYIYIVYVFSTCQCLDGLNVFIFVKPNSSVCVCMYVCMYVCMSVFIHIPSRIARTSPLALVIGFL